MIREDLLMTSAPVVTVDPRLDILFESASLLVVRKPAGLVCHPTKTDAWSSLAGRIRLHLGPEAPVRLLHRLDRETSGVVVAAKTPEAARELGRQMEGGTFSKSYLAIVRGHPQASQGVVSSALGPDPLSVVAIKDCVRPDGALASSAWRLLQRWRQDDEPFSLIEVNPLSGRKHQIRIHLASIGLPIVGDKLYGGDETIYLDFVSGKMKPEQQARMMLPCQALHARSLEWEWRERVYRFECAPEAWFTSFIPND